MSARNACWTPTPTPTRAPEGGPNGLPRCQNFRRRPTFARPHAPNHPDGLRTVLGRDDCEFRNGELLLASLVPQNDIRSRNMGSMLIADNSDRACMNFGLPFQDALKVEKLGKQGRLGSDRIDRFNSVTYEFREIDTKPAARLGWAQEDKREHGGYRPSRVARAGAVSPSEQGKSSSFSQGRRTDFRSQAGAFHERMTT